MSSLWLICCLLTNSFPKTIVRIDRSRLLKSTLLESLIATDSKCPGGCGGAWACIWGSLSAEFGVLCFGQPKFITKGVRWLASKNVQGSLKDTFCPFETWRFPPT